MARAHCSNASTWPGTAEQVFALHAERGNDRGRGKPASVAPASRRLFRFSLSPEQGSDEARSSFARNRQVELSGVRPIVLKGRGFEVAYAEALFRKTAGDTPALPSEAGFSVRSVCGRVPPRRFAGSGLERCAICPFTPRNLCRKTRPSNPEGRAPAKS